MEERVPLLSGSGEGGGSASRSARLPAGSSAEFAGSNAKFDLLFLRRFWRVMRVVHPRLCCKSLLVLFLLIFTRAAEEYNYYLAGLLPSKFYAALVGKDQGAFKHALWIAAAVIACVCVCKSAGEMIAGLLYVRWRALITRFLHLHYFQRINYYLVNIIDHKIDNPDQRITQDVDRFCQQLSKVLPLVILSPFIIAYYTFKTYQSMGYIGPVCIYGFFVVSTVINKFIMSPIVSRIIRQEKLEGNFRFHHVQVRASAESIAFYRAGKLEGEKANGLLKVLLRTQLSVVHWQFPLNFSVNIFDYISTMISYSLVGFAVFSGKYDDLNTSVLSAVISRNAFFSLYLLNNFSTLVDQATLFTEIAGYTHRIGEMMESLKELNSRRDDGNEREMVEDDDEEQKKGGDRNRLSSPVEGSESSSDLTPERVSINAERHFTSTHSGEVAAVIRDLSVAPPKEEIPLVEGLNLEFKKGKNILILGESGSGKSSILRVLRKLWKPAKGSAQLCSDDSHHDIMFLPQKPYLTSGSLADQVTFPEKPKEVTEVVTHYYQGTVPVSLCEERIMEALRMAGLIHLRDRLGGVNVAVQENWYDVVSPGEMQKIAFARVFFHKPPFTILDEATCSLSEENEQYFYNSLQQLGCTVMSVGHRSSLRQYHHCILVLSGDGTWQLVSSDDTSYS